MCRVGTLTGQVANVAMALGPRVNELDQRLAELALTVIDLQRQTIAMRDNSNGGWNWS